MNDFEFAKPLEELEGTILKNMLNTVPKENRYTYIHEGNAQVLDHILVTNNIAPHTIVDPVHKLKHYEEHGRVSDHDQYLLKLI